MEGGWASSKLQLISAFSRASCEGTPRPEGDQPTPVQTSQNRPSAGGGTDAQDPFGLSRLDLMLYAGVSAKEGR